MEISISMNWPPSVNNLWRPNRSGGLRLTDEARNYKKSTYYQLYLMKQSSKFAITDVLEVRCYCHPPDKRSRDLDNLAKVLLDTLQYCEIIPNDKQVKRLLMEMMEPDIESKGYVQVEIKTMEK